jgi:hypothetical protein
MKILNRNSMKLKQPAISPLLDSADGGNITIEDPLFSVTK